MEILYLTFESIYKFPQRQEHAIFALNLAGFLKNIYYLANVIMQSDLQVRFNYKLEN